MMNKFFVVAIVGVVFQASLGYAYPDCATNDLDDLTFYPMPECNKFYQCVGGEKHVFTCQEGLVFNFGEQVCDYPENVDCDDQQPPTEGPNTTEEPSTSHPDCAGINDLGFYPMPECNKFFQCIEGNRFVFTCQEGLVFNFAEQVCDYPENVDCDNQQPPTEGPGTTEEPPAVHPDCDGINDLSFYPMPECNKFFQCIEGNQFVFTCQEGLVFNFAEQVCDYPENVDCDNQQPPTEGPGTTEEPPAVHPDCDGIDDLSFYPMPECNKFFQCIEGNQFVFTCQEGLVFNFAEQVCDYPENVDCDNQQPPTEGPGSTEEPPAVHPDCDGIDDLSFYPMPECNKFFQCIGGNQFVFTCQEGLVFNVEEQVCDYPENVDCNRKDSK